MSKKHSKEREVFNSFWHGKQLTPSAIMCLNSFLYHNFDFNLWTYDQIKYVPQGVRICEAESIYSKKALFSVEPDAVTSFSDNFRYNLLYKYGGWWVDTDVVCNTFVLPETLIAFASQSKKGTIASGQIKFPKGHRIMAAAVDQVENTDSSTWGSKGPQLLTKLISSDLDEYRWDTKHFYPIHWAESMKFILPEYKDEIEERTHDSMFIHLYSGMYRRVFGFDENRFLPPRGSFLEALYLRWGIGEIVSCLKPIDEALLRRKIAYCIHQNWLKKRISRKELHFHTKTRYRIISLLFHLKNKVLS